MVNTILRLPTVRSITGLSTSTIYLQISQNKFPRQVSIGKRCVGWSESSIIDWVNQRIDESKKENDDES